MNSEDKVEIMRLMVSDDGGLESVELREGVSEGGGEKKATSFEIEGFSKRALSEICRFRCEEREERRESASRESIPRS